MERERERLNQSWRSHIVSVSEESRRGRCKHAHTHTSLTHIWKERARLDSSIIPDAVWLRAETGAAMHS